MENSLLPLFNSFVQYLFLHQIQLKMLHFQTKKYAIHKSVDMYLGKFNTNFDSFMEVAQGISGKLTLKEINIFIPTLNDENVLSSLNDAVKMLKSINPKLKDFSELTTINDQMLADIQQLKYLLTFE